MRRPQGKRKDETGAKLARHERDTDAQREASQRQRGEDIGGDIGGDIDDAGRVIGTRSAVDSDGQRWKWAAAAAATVAAAGSDGARRRGRQGRRPSRRGGRQNETARHEPWTSTAATTAAPATPATRDTTRRAGRHSHRPPRDWATQRATQRTTQSATQSAARGRRIGAAGGAERRTHGSRPRSTIKDQRATGLQQRGGRGAVPWRAAVARLAAATAHAPRRHEATERAGDTRQGSGMVDNAGPLLRGAAAQRRGGDDRRRPRSAAR